MSKNKNYLIATMLFIASLVLVIFILSVNMFIGSSEYESTGEQISSVDVLNCTSSKKIQSFFDYGDIEEFEHKIKITFNDRKPYDMMYTFGGIFKNNEIANSGGGLWKIKYHTYMNENNLDVNSVENSFSSVDNRAWLNLYTRATNLNLITTKLFLIAPEDLAKVRRSDNEELKKFYEEMGFECETIGR